MKLGFLSCCLSNGWAQTGRAACFGLRRASIGEVEERPAGGREDLCCIVAPLASKGGGRDSCRSRSSGLTSLSSIFRLAGVEERSNLVADGGGAATWPEGPEIEACE